VGSPLQRIREEGPAALGPFELIAVVLCREDDDSELRMPHAKQLLDQIGSIRNLSRFADATFRQYNLDDLHVFRFLAAFELGRRSKDAKQAPEADLRNPEEVHQAFSFLQDEFKEQVWVALLDVKNRLIIKQQLHTGTLDSSVVGTRDIFREALRVNAASIVLVHNHPSGDPTPSPEDVELTQRVKAAGKLLEVEVLDHVIIGADTFASLHRLGLMG